MKFKWVYNQPQGRTCLEQLKISRNTNKSFFLNALPDLPDYKVMKDLEKASERILQALLNKEKIIIFGDDDLDGVTSTYILFDFLEQVGSQSHYYYIPNRLTDRHGLQPYFIEHIKKENVDLVITVDGCVSSFEAVEEINKLGIDVIITDHHLVPETVPNAYAVVNPKQTDCEFSYDMLAGVGVVFFLVSSLADKLSMPMSKTHLLWTAIGTIADKAPLTGVNRIIVKEALKNWIDPTDETLQLLKCHHNFSDDYPGKMSFISFITRLLSGGRAAGGEHLGLQLLLSGNHAKTGLLESLLEQKKEYESNMKELFTYLDKAVPHDLGTYYVHFDEDDVIPYPLLGAAANFVANKYRVPAVFLKNKGEEVICEGRCIEGFNLVNAFTFAEGALIQYGGHVKAAGFSAKKENLNEFYQLFKEFAAQNKDSIVENKKLEIDIVLDFYEFNRNCLSDLEIFQPWGMNNPEPVILIKNCEPQILDTLFYIQNRPFLDTKQLYDVAFTYKSESMIQVLDYHLSNYGQSNYYHRANKYAN